MHFRRLHLSLATILLAALPLSAQVKKSADGWTEWETISPEGEEFTVSMPKNPTTESTTFPYHKMELNARLYLATSPGGPVLAVASFSGIKSNPAAYSDFARFNSYIDAFKKFFPAKIRKETPVRLILVSSRPFQGHTGRSYTMTLGDLSGSVHAFATRKRFYAIVSLNKKKDEALEEKFLSSFLLPERQPDPPKVVAATEAEQAAGANNQNAQKDDDAGRPNPQNPGEREQVLPAPENNAEPGAGNVANAPQPDGTGQQNQKRGPISGGMLNGRAIYLPKPDYPPGDVSGMVAVAVVIDEHGSVIEARAISGPQPLHTAAVNAARLARFSPTLLMGEPVRVSGTITYNFVRQD
jgi:outer membrane biosynthesis protein TonB